MPKGQLVSPSTAALTGRIEDSIERLLRLANKQANALNKEIEIAARQQQSEQDDSVLSSTDSRTEVIPSLRSEKSETQMSPSLKSSFSLKSSLSPKSSSSNNMATWYFGLPVQQAAECGMTVNDKGNVIFTRTPRRPLGLPIDVPHPGDSNDPLASPKNSLTACSKKSSSICNASTEDTFLGTFDFPMHIVHNGSSRVCTAKAAVHRQTGSPWLLLYINVVDTDGSKLLAMKMELRERETRNVVINGDSYKVKMAVNTAQSMDVINRSFKDSLTCSICQDILRVPVYTVNQCQHVYCETCIREAKLHGDTCPNCREPIRSLMRSTFIENILDIFYQMNPDIQRREPCERWVDPPPRSPSRESDIVILNIGDNPDAPILHMVQFASYYQRALNALYEPLNEVDTDVGSRRSRRLRGLPPEEVTETADADDEEEDEVFDAAVGPDRSGMNVAPSEDDGEAEGDGSWIQEVPENRTVETRPPPPRRGRKRPRTDQEQSDGTEQPERPEPETSAAGNMTSPDVESRNCVIRRAQR